MKRIKVMVSPFYGGDEWIDAGTGIVFKQNKTGDAAIYSIPENADMSGIRKAIQLNTLFLVEGTIADLKEEAKAPKEETKVVEEVKEVEPAVETKVEEKEEPKTAPAKKRTSKK